MLHNTAKTTSAFTSLAPSRNPLETTFSKMNIKTSEHFPFPLKFVNTSGTACTYGSFTRTQNPGSEESTSNMRLIVCITYAAPVSLPPDFSLASSPCCSKYRSGITSVFVSSRSQTRRRKRQLTETMRHKRINASWWKSTDGCDAGRKVSAARGTEPSNRTMPSNMRSSSLGFSRVWSIRVKTFCGATSSIHSSTSGETSLTWVPCSGRTSKDIGLYSRSTHRSCKPTSARSSSVPLHKYVAYGRLQAKGSYLKAVDIRLQKRFAEWMQDPLTSVLTHL